MLRNTTKTIFTLVTAAAAATTLLAGSALGQETQPTTQPTTAPAGDLPSAKSLIDKALNAMGGEKKLKAIPDATVKASVNSQQGPVVIETLRKGEKKFLIKVNQMGMDIFMGRNGDDAWTVNPMQGTVRLSIKEFLAQADQFPHPMMFRNVKEKFNTIETVGSEVIDGDDCYKIRFADPKEAPPVPAGDNFTLVSKKTGLPVAFEYPNPMGGAIRFHLKEYKAFDDFTFFTKVTIEGGPQAMEIQFDSISFDAIDDAVFAVPASLTPAPAPAAPAAPPGG